MSPAASAVENVPLVNASFDDPWDGQGPPPGWGVYAGGGETLLKSVDVPGGKALRVEDNDPVREIGVTQTFPVKPGEVYQVTVGVRGVAGANLSGAYLQFRFLPSGQFTQVPLYTDYLEEFEDISTVAMAPADTTQATIYLYSHAGPTPKFIIDNVRVESGVTAPEVVLPPPDPVPPQYDKLRDLHDLIPLVAGGKAAGAIVIPAAGTYQEAAAGLQAVIRKATGVTVPIIKDTDPKAAIPLRQNLIILGNRSTNRASNALYDLCYSLVDLKYPGQGGHVVRTVHNPFGDGYSFVVVGGSDAKGVAAAAKALAPRLAAAGQRGRLSLGWTMITKLGTGLKPNMDIKTAETWDDSKGYGATGYFGWNSLSKRMAMYYMWGDEFSARELVRLAFPDEQALKDIDRVDDERVENKKDPLAGTYHYNSHMMILFWDLIEESPVFSEDEKLRITNAFARQLNHRKGEGIYQLMAPPGNVSSRHGQWAAISHYCLGRYFDKYYPNPIWAQCVRGGQFAFQSLHKSAYVDGEADNLFWYNTGTAPILVYMVLTGDRVPLENGVLGELLRDQEMLINGLSPDDNLRYSALTYSNQAAYLTGDGRWVTYRDRCQMDTDLPRLGWSWWPEPSLKPALPTNLSNQWSVNALPKPMWLGRGSGVPHAQSFQFGSFRSAADGTGDFILLDGFNGASRNAYHTFDLLELRLGGRTLLKGYYNQVLTSADGMVEPLVPMDGALLYRDVVGGHATAVGEVAKAAYCGWRRSLVQRVGKYAIICDDLTFRAASENMKVSTSWQPNSGAWDPVAQAVKITVPGNPTNLPGWTVLPALNGKYTSSPEGPDYAVTLPTLNTLLLRGREPGQWLEVALKLDRAFAGEAYADFLNYVDRGVVQVYLDGKKTGEPFDNRADSVAETTLPLGTVKLAAGTHKVRLEVVKVHPGSDKAFVGFRGLSLRAPGAPVANAPASFELRGCDMQETAGSGVVNMHWTGAVQPGQRRKAFYVLAHRAAEEQLACVRLSDQAAMAALPEPALLVSGEEGDCAGDLVVLATDHLYGHNLTKSRLAAADKPVDLSWDFATGRLAVVTTAETALGLRLASAGGVKLNGKALKAAVTDGLAQVTLPAGRHELTGAKPEAKALTALTSDLQAKLATAQQARIEALARGLPRPTVTAPPLPEPITAKVGGKVVDMITVPSPQGELVAVAEGQAVHLLDAAGQEVRQLDCDGNVRVLNWWAEHGLLLVGCQDEQVIAFTLAGERKWVFTSVMDPAVYEAAKPYWFKTAGGHEGIHGLITGTFYEGRSQAFVGSACTLEVLDENGQLIKRLPVFWGPLWKFLFVNGPEGRRNLLIAQWLNGYDGIWVLDPEKDLTGSGYSATPEGHTNVGGWTAQQRTALVAADLEGDGKTKVVTCINGTWNRVTVFTEAGLPLANAQFGAGASNAPYAQMRDLELADLNGDGKQEIAVADYEGLVVALDSRCAKLWSVKLPAAPNRLQAVTPAGATTPLLVVACQDGLVVTLNGAGQVVGQSRIEGAPTERLLLQTPAGPRAVFGTEQGAVGFFAAQP